MNFSMTDYVPVPTINADGSIYGSEHDNGAYLVSEGVWKGRWGGRDAEATFPTMSAAFAWVRACNAACRWVA